MFGDRAIGNQLLDGQLIFFELADGDGRAINGTGGITALTREPSGRRASTVGLSASIRRPSGK
jgi:hypothetical protein